ncbi:MAG: heparan-alpha-glucosaminide N-acetyltransferase domain-containing protein [Lentisphaeraceae bacterium]|nr:heparan-alpha-glucosaminide N-acetyltransferase domain-containing protein [Lentisphaeraceae bacterium]
MFLYLLTAIIFGLFAYHFVDGIGELSVFIVLQVMFLPVVYHVYFPAFPWICSFLVGIIGGGGYRILKSRKKADSQG